jgi:hypothetical protein
MEEVHLYRSLPQEDPRMAVRRVSLDKHFNVFHPDLTRKVAEFVFNFDELGPSDWHDCPAKKGIAPSRRLKGDPHDAVGRSHRHLELVVCVSAAGDTLGLSVRLD